MTVKLFGYSAILTVSDNGKISVLIYFKSVPDTEKEMLKCLLFLELVKDYLRELNNE